ncbi:MAG TPA: hypothetical protein PLE45_10330 [Spirochaetota bacterium]|nr:hypothetical protein [Spirochaetota bacterium]HPP04085.1 hypothetical protein [Spirochaetota bacterium]
MESIFFRREVIKIISSWVQLHRVRIYISEGVYNKLILVHDKINSFIIAIFIRELLEVYFLALK